MNYLLILFFSILLINPCNKEGQESTQINKEITPGKTEPKSDSPVFLGRFSGGRLLIEDSKTYEKNAFTWAEDTLQNYDKYYDYLKSIAQKHASYKDDIPGYYFGDELSEFKKLTTLNKGDKLYISAKSGVYPAEIKGYYMNFDDIIGSGIVFYAVAEAHGITFEENEIFICSANSGMSPFISGKLTVADNPGIFGSVKSLMMEKVKDIKVRDESSEKEKYIPVTGIDTSELVILRGSFTEAGVKEYIAGYTKRQSFDNFAYYIIIVDAQGRLIREFSGLVKDSFTYESVIGIADINGDGIYEVLTEDGYYEGSGYNLHMLDGSGYKVITGGFFFGV